MLTTIQIWLHLSFNKAHCICWCNALYTSNCTQSRLGYTSFPADTVTSRYLHPTVIRLPGCKIFLYWNRGQPDVPSAGVKHPGQDVDLSGCSPFNKLKASLTWQLHLWRRYIQSKGHKARLLSACVPVDNKHYEYHI